MERVLVVAAHPDDVDFSAAGTVASWTAAGIEVAYCIVTDGDAGSFDPEVQRTELARIRRAEQREAASRLGVGDLEFLGYPDGRLVPSLELRRDIARAIRRTRPQRVVCPSPERVWTSVYASHPDHLAAGQAALAAVYPDSRNRFAHPELLGEGWEPWTVPEVWMMSSPTPDRFVDVTDRFELKLATLCCHASQIADEAALKTMLLDWMGSVGAAAGLTEGRLAEGFHVIDTA